MERILILFHLLIEQETHSIWIHPNQSVKDFKEEWHFQEINTTYDRFFYHEQLKCRLDENKTWKENHVVSGDSIIYI